MILLALSAQPTMTQNGRLASLFVCLPPPEKKKTYKRASCFNIATYGDCIIAPPTK